MKRIIIMIALLWINSVQAQDIIAFHTNPHHTGNEQIDKLFPEIVKSYDDYSDAPENSIASQNALVQWNTLSKKQLSFATTLEELYQIGESAPVGSEAEQLISAKFSEVLSVQVANIKTAKEANEILSYAPDSSPARFIALGKLKEFGSKEILLLKTADQASKLYDLLGWVALDAEENLLIQKWFELCINPQEIENMYEMISDSMQIEMRGALYEKWKKFYLSLAEVKKQYNPIDYDGQYSFPSTIREEFLLKRRVELTDSLEELIVLNKMVPPGSEEERAVAKKMASFMQKK